MFETSCATTSEVWELAAYASFFISCQHRSLTCHLLYKSFTAPPPIPFRLHWEHGACNLGGSERNGGKRKEEQRKKSAPAPLTIPTTTILLLPLFPLSLNRLKHKHNWTCWKLHNGTEGGKWSHTLSTHGCLGQGAINSTPGYCVLTRPPVQSPKTSLPKCEIKDEL